MWWNKGKWNICTASSLNMSIRARDTGNPADDEKCSGRKELIEWRECIWAPLTPWYISGKGVLWLWRVLIVFRAASTAPGKTFHRQSGLVDTGFLHRSFGFDSCWSLIYYTGPWSLGYTFLNWDLYIIWKLTKYAFRWSMDMTIFGRDICIWKSGIWGCKNITILRKSPLKLFRLSS